MQFSEKDAEQEKQDNENSSWKERKIVAEQLKNDENQHGAGEKIKPSPP